MRGEECPFLLREITKGSYFKQGSVDLNILNESLREGTDFFAIQYMKPADAFQGLVGKPFHGNVNQVFLELTGKSAPARTGRAGGDDGDVFFPGMVKRRFQ